MKKIVHFILTITFIKGLTAELEDIWDYEEIHKDELDKFIEETKSFPFYFDYVVRCEFNEHPFTYLGLGFIMQTETTFDEDTGMTTEIIKDNLNQTAEVITRSHDNKIVKQTVYNSENEIVRQFQAFEGSYASKTLLYSELLITFHKLKWQTVYETYNKETNVSESYTVTNAEDIIRSTSKHNEKITQTAVIYAEGDWYYASAVGDETKTIIMGTRNYLNTIFQRRADNTVRENNRIIRGIFLGTGALVGNHRQVVTKKNTRIFINNGIIINDSVIMINRYPPCVRRQFTEDDKVEHFTDNEPNQYYDRIICSTKNQTRLLIKKGHNPPLSKIFANKVTEWDACCNLEYKSKREKIHFLKNNNIEYEGEREILEDIIDLGQAYKYVDELGLHKVIWKKQEENSEDEAESSMGNTSY